MVDNWMAGYPGKTIQYIANQADGSLAQGPNIILLMAGTNDMNPNPSISTEGSEPNAAAQRLGNLIDQCLSRVPSAAVIVAKIPNAADASQESNTQAFNALIPGVVSSRAQAGKHVAMVDMSVIQASQTVDGIHPNEAAYQQMGDIWYQGIHALPSGWIQHPVGPDPPNPLNCGGSNSGSSSSGTGDINANGGPDPGIPAPVFLHGKMNCEIALGLGHPGNWKFNQNWVSGGQIASGLHLDMPGVQLFDMDGDGKAEYLWVNEQTGQLICWHNNQPDPWAPDGDGEVDYIELGDGGKTNIWKNNHPDPWSPLPNANAAGVGHPPAEISFADVDNDGKADYIWIDPISGQPHVWYNKFPADPTWAAGPYPDVGSEGAGGQNVIFGKLEKTGGATAVFVNPDNGAISAFVNGCGPGAHKRSTAVNMRPPQIHPKRELRQRASCPGQPGPPGSTPTPTTTQPFVPVTTGTSNIHHGHQPTPTGIEPSGPWTTVQCDYGSLGSAILNQNDASQRWNDAQADNAWQNLVAAWNYQVQHSYLPECQPPSRLPDFELAASDLAELCRPPHPLSDSDQLINGEMPAFQEAFSPLPNHFSAATIALDVLSTVTGIAFAGFWSAAKPAIGGALGDVTKDGVNSAISSAYTIGQQYVTLGSTRSAVINSLDDIEAHIWDAANAASNQTLRDLMSSYDSGNLTALGNIIANGAVLAINNHMEEQLNKVAQQIIYGGLIKARWQAPEGGETIPPYVMYVPNGVYECGADPKTAIALPGDGDKLGRMINADAAKKNVFCDQYGNSFFLLQASSAQTPNNVDGDGLPGGDKGNLDGSRWGGVTLELVTQSVMHGFQNSGQNPFGLNGGPDYVDAWTSTSNPTTAPGFWGLPLCFSVDAVLGNTSKIWPTLCPGDGGAAQTFFNRIGPSGFLPGQCALHWELYHDSGDRRYMDVTVKDAAGYNVGLAHSIDATPPNRPAGVTGRLPNPLNYYISQLVTGHRADVITFSYGDQTWRNTDAQCTIGEFNANDGNNVSGDCAFQY
ncbi:hypothetical protein PRZ48_015259 [Zasmidium cellare]|uniref:SGNH hydrolase-type esterase domain-containing protein n=1 Tax=Zasmidium cellare TaxID=395010 RepID=A0ABR0DWJ4_ZASCE|nr:hypothetical protein PRZ48_015259 [Zasmidium cellare]